MELHLRMPEQMHLGVPEEIATEDACKMEHDVSDESFEKIKEHLTAKGENLQDMK